MKYYTEYKSIESFLSDPEFVALVRNNDKEGIEKIVSSAPDKKVLIEGAQFLLQNLVIEGEIISDQQIEDDLTDLFRQINKKKRSVKHMFFLISAVAASVAIFFFAIHYPASNQLKEEKVELFSLLDQMDTSIDEVHIITGASQTHVKNNETIEQKEDGGVVTGSGEKIESADIENEYLQVVVPNGKRTSIRFCDGSLARVNSGSKIVYPKQFGNTSRDIYVDGEVYLYVTPDKTKPFLVHTKTLDVVVLGTTFNINAYSGDAESSVVLVEGSLEVASSLQKSRLIPNQGYFYKDGKVQLKDVDVSFYISWIDGIMKLKGDPLSTIFNNLSRYYRLDIRFSDRIANEVYKGKIDLNDSIETILDNISLSTSLSYTRNDNTIYIE